MRNSIKPQRYICSPSNFHIEAEDIFLNKPERAGFYRRVKIFDSNNHILTFDREITRSATTKSEMDQTVVNTLISLFGLDEKQFREFIIEENDMPMFAIDFFRGFKELKNQLGLRIYSR